MRPPLSPDLFELDPGTLWVMHCADGPVPLPAAHAVTSLLPRETQPWKLRFKDDFQEIPATARQQAAELIGATPLDVTLTATTSAGLVMIAQGHPWQPGDEIVLPLGEFPANFWPWQALANRGVSLRQVPLWDDHRAGKEAWLGAPPPPRVDPETRLLAALGPKTRLLSVSWVRFQDGLRLDLERLAAGCKERGVALVIDGVQGAGTVELDSPALTSETATTGLVAFACGVHKGLLAPQGLGFLWTATDYRRQLTPTGSWLSLEDATDFRRPATDVERLWLTDGRRLEQGVPNLLGCVAFNASSGLILQVSVSRIAAHIATLRRILIDRLARLPSPALRQEARRLSGLDEERRLASILALHHRGRGQKTWDRLLGTLRQQGIYASIKEGYLRLALHGWHTPGDVERLVQALDKFAA